MVHNQQHCNMDIVLRFLPNTKNNKNIIIIMIAPISRARKGEKKRGEVKGEHGNF